MKTLRYSILKCTSSIPLSFLTTDKANTKISILICCCCSSFFLSLSLLMHNSKTIQHISDCTPSDCFAIRDFPFLVRAACKLRLVSYSSKHTVWSLSFTPFCAYMYSSKTKHHIRMFYLSNNCSTNRDLG